MPASHKEKSEKGESNSESAAHDRKSFRRPVSRASKKWNLEKFGRTEAFGHLLFRAGSIPFVVAMLLVRCRDEHDDGDEALRNRLTALL
jgi:hypothetical protein